MPIDQNSSRTVDIVVVGSGAAALAAAVTAHDGGSAVEVFESAELLGGASAVSGGQPWIPMNSHMAEDGLADSFEDAALYLEHITRGHEPDADRLETFIRRSSEAIDYLEGATPLEFVVCTKFSDYHADLPGGKLSGRSLDVVPFNARAALGAWDDRVRRSAQIPSMTLDEMAGAGAAANPKNGEAIAAGTGELSQGLIEVMQERDRDGVRTCGGALVTSLLTGVLEREIPVTTSARVDRLLQEDGRVTGVVVEIAGEEVAVHARKGVILAAGGFEWNAKLVKSFIGVTDLHPISPPSLKGDALVMGMEIGAAIANMSVLWSVPSTYDESATLDGERYSMMNTPRQEPGVIIVNANGKRFVNEAISYNHMPLAFRQFDSATSSYPNEKAWLIFDQKVRDRTVAADFQPGLPTPPWVQESDSIEGLAEKIGVDPSALRASIDRWNAQVASGADTDFGRGTVWFEGWTSGGGNPGMLVAIDEPNYFAMRIYDGANGTAGGLDIDRDGRVKAMRGGVIPGLYAAGNTAANVYGGGYPGGGATLGQALTFGYLAGKHASGTSEAATAAAEEREVSIAR